ncbi:putative Phosphatase 2C-like domain-containing protein [Seiridium cardinale]|uniref:Phosphatase 2C-like domain-containing protein n=1 Tax=Seiridium cardinale TaxID=138064 RepID=A0ABR2XR90_9PEZI
MNRLMRQLPTQACVFNRRVRSSLAFRSTTGALASTRLRTTNSAKSSRLYSSAPNASSPSNPTLNWLYYGITFSIGLTSGVLLFSGPRTGTQTTPDPTGAITKSTAATKDPITERLTSEASIFSDGSSPVAAYHVARIDSNSPCEDHFVHGQLSSKNGLLEEPWHAWAVFDGHAGSHTAALLARELLHSVQDPLSRLSGQSSDEAVETTIRKAFVSLDDALLHGAVAAVRSDAPYHEQVVKLMPAYTGSCALLSLLDPKTWTLRVACVGDSRAVLGQQGAAGKWAATALSVDQTGSNEDEIARTNAEHPGESEITKAGRVLGIMVSRGFGDGRWKWDLDFQAEVKKKFDGFNPLSPEKYAVKTPPYLTAEPVITTTKLDDARPSFLIMASDGFWDRVSNEQAVTLIGGWLVSRTADGQQRENQKNTITSSVSQSQHGPFQLEKHRQGEPGFLFTEERTTYMDNNAAVHLVRNALGGSFQDMVSANLAVGPPFSRYARDDITVQVIFFNPQSQGA